MEVKQRQLSTGDVVRLLDLYKLLTMLPGARSEYSLPEFTGDLYLTDQQGQAVTRSGRALRWHASTGTKGAGVLATVGRTGQQQRYWGISLRGARRMGQLLAGVPGGIGLGVEDYADFLGREYLATAAAPPVRQGTVGGRTTWWCTREQA